MRSDMSKVITERPRIMSRDSGQNTGNPEHRGRSFDDLPSKESMRKGHKAAHRAKEFSDLLGPLKKYFVKQIGRPWDKVFSEVCATIDNRKVTGRHVLEHVEQFVASRCEAVSIAESATGFVNNRIIGARSYRHSVGEGQLMVDPETGLIKRAKRLAPRPVFKPESVLKELGPNHVGIKHKGVWYDVTIAVWEKKTTQVEITTRHMGGEPFVYTREQIVYESEGKTFSSLNDVCIGMLDLDYSYPRYRGDAARLRDIYKRANVYGKAKKTMSSTELRRHNLKND